MSVPKAQLLKAVEQATSDQMARILGQLMDNLITRDKEAEGEFKGALGKLVAAHDIAVAAVEAL